MRVKRRLALWKLWHDLRRAPKRNIILGAGSTRYPGWTATNIRALDITNEQHWRRSFQPGSIDLLLMSHVLEHIAPAEGPTALRLCYQYLKPRGCLRIAVPDGYRRDAAYLAEVSPPRDGHQALYTIDSLSALLSEAGFELDPLEYFDKEGKFHFKEWDQARGHVARSRRYDKQTSFPYEDMFYTSVIIDAVKPGGKPEGPRG